MLFMTSRPPCWCPKTMKRRPCWCLKPILWELNPFLLLKLSFAPINLYLSFWSQDWICSIRPTKVQDRDCRKAAWPVCLSKTLPPNGPFVPNNFFRPRTIYKVAIIKTTSAIIAFSFLLLSSSSLFHFLISFSFVSVSLDLIQRNMPIDALSLQMTTNFVRFAFKKSPAGHILASFVILSIYFRKISAIL